MTDTADAVFAFDYGTEPANPRTAVFQALGAASMCWTNPEGAGVFDPARATVVGDALLAELDRLAEPETALLGLATTRELLDELYARLCISAGIHPEPGSDGAVIEVNDRYVAVEAERAAVGIRTVLDELRAGQADGAHRLLDYRTVDA